MSAGNVHTGLHHWLRSSIGLSQSFVQEWTELSAVDEFALESMNRPGEVMRERDVLGDIVEHPEVTAFSQPHGLRHCMALTAELPHSGLMFFVSAVVDSKVRVYAQKPNHDGHLRSWLIVHFNRTERWGRSNMVMGQGLAHGQLDGDPDVLTARRGGRHQQR